MKRSRASRKDVNGVRNQPVDAAPKAATEQQPTSSVALWLRAETTTEHIHVIHPACGHGKIHNKFKFCTLLDPDVQPLLSSPSPCPLPIGPIPGVYLLPSPDPCASSNSSIPSGACYRPLSIPTFAMVRCLHASSSCFLCSSPLSSCTLCMI